MNEGTNVSIHASYRRLTSGQLRFLGLSVPGHRGDPNITLLVPCRFAIYRVDYAGKAGGAASDGGQIVFGVAGPVREADALGIQRREAATVAAKELKAILGAVADFFAKK